MLQEEFLKNVAEGKIDDETMKYAQECLDELIPVGEELFGVYAQKIIDREKIQKRIVDFLTDMDARLMTAKQVGKAVGISTEKASRYLDELVEKEVIESFEGKKKRKYAK